MRGIFGSEAGNSIHVYADIIFYIHLRRCNYPLRASFPLSNTVQHGFFDFSGKIGYVRVCRVRVFKEKIDTAVDGLDDWSRLQIIDSV